MNPTALNFSLSEFAALAKAKQATVSNRVRQDGHYRGVQPLKLPNGRYRFPRREVLAALGVANIDTKPADLSDALGFFADRGLPTDDELVVAAAKALSGTFAGAGYEATVADDTRRLSNWLSAHRVRVQATRLPEGERRQALFHLDTLASELEALRAVLAQKGAA